MSKHPNVQRMELVYIRDKLEQALAIAVRGGFVVQDEIMDAIKQTTAAIKEINDDEKAASDTKNQTPDATGHNDPALPDVRLSARVVAFPGKR